MIQQPKIERSIILQKAIEDKKLYHLIKSRDRESVLYQSSILKKKARTKSLFHIKSQKRVSISYNQKTYYPTKD